MFAAPRPLTLAAIGLWLAIAARPAPAQVHPHPYASARPLASNLIVPQARVFRADRSPKQCVEVTGVKVGVVILEQAAITTMDISLKNPTGSRQEAELLIPVPEGAAIRGFTFSGSGKEPSAELLPKKDATDTYKSIVAKIKDPALLEFAGMNLIRSSVFPIDAHGEQKVRLTYEHLLPADGDRIDYMLPRTESVHYSVPWEVGVAIKAKRPISTVYSPSHQVEPKRAAKNAVGIKVSVERMKEPGPFQLSYLPESGKGMAASLIAYPDAKSGGGYFLLLAGLPAKASTVDENGVPEVKREITIVIDRSGSMQGEKIEQAREAALQVVSGLYDGEAFNIIDYSDAISSFAPAPVIKNKSNAEEARHYIRRLSAGGGTNLHDALLEALRPKPTAGMLPIVLFLTDGLPTVGVRDEATIRKAAVEANTYERRIFTFGVGYDVNAPLLDHLAQNSRAASTYVLPNEEIEAKISQIYRRLYGPVLSEPELKVLDREGDVTTRRISELLPDAIPDLFEGDKLVLLGRYEGDEPLRFRLTGNCRDKLRTFKFEFKLDKATTRNSFVPRLWASRKIARLVDEIRQAGADSRAVAAAVAAGTSDDPKMKELVDEIVRLSVEFGILTEYTAFLAREGSDLTARDDILRQANGNLVMRAQNSRVGIGGVNQAMNGNFQRSQMSLNRRNDFYDANMNRVQITRVQQVNDRCFFQQGNRWVDGSAINDDRPEPDDTVAIGSPEFMQLVDKLVAQNRQGNLAMSGEILLRIDGKNILVTAD